MAWPSDLTASALCQGKQLLSTCLQTASRARSGHRFLVIGAVLILAIAAADWLIVAMEREASFAAYETAGSNLSKGMNAQTSRMLGAVDKVLWDIPAALALGDIATPDLIKAAMRAGASSDLLADRQKQLQGVESLTLVDAGGLVANSSPGGLPAGTDVSGSEFFLRLSANADAAPFVSAPVRDAASGRWSSLLARRMTDLRGNFAGVVSAQLSLDDLEDFYRVAMPPYRVVTVMRNDGTILVQYPHRGERTGQKASGFASRPPQPSACMAYHGPDLVDGASVVAAVCTMNNMPLVIETSATKAAELFFRKAKPDGTVEFVFVIALVFICAFTSRLAGLEPIIGAFVAGLLLNRFIPESGVLMNRIKFAGDALFVPFFMVYVGVLADPAAVFGSIGSLGIVLAMVALNIVSKWLAASGAGMVLSYRGDERRMLFGLSVNHAAAVLAIALVGFKLGLFGQRVLDGAIFLIIASCFVGPLVTQRAGKRLASGSEDRQSGPDRSVDRVLVAIAKPSSIRDLLALAFLIRGRRSEESVYPVAVVPESANSRLEIAKAENGLAQAVVQGVSAGIPVSPATRVSVNVSEGIMQAALESRAGAIVLGWNKPPKLSHAFFGGAIDQVVRSAPELVVVARITSPLNSVSQLGLIFRPSWNAIRVFIADSATWPTSRLRRGPN